MAELDQQNALNQPLNTLNQALESGRFFAYASIISKSSSSRNSTFT